MKTRSIILLIIVLLFVTNGENSSADNVTLTVQESTFSDARTLKAPIIWNSGSLTFTKTAPGQQDCITANNCLTRITVLYNSARETVSGNQGCTYVGPANTEWAIGNIANWNTLTYRRLYSVNNCSPPGMVGVPMVLHLISEDIYLQVTFNSWQSAGSNFSYTRSTGPQVASAAPFDLDGDRKTDISIFRPAPAEWWYLRSSDGTNRAFQFGQTSDRIVAADYTGDGKSDVAFWRPSTGEWFVLRSEDSSFFSFPFGNSNDIPTPADFDGDGKADPAIFRPSSATWFIIRSTDGGSSIQGFGTSGDRPVPADYDGDRKADLAIFRPSDGTWWLNRSQNGGTVVYNFGTGTDKTVAGDYTGDGRADVAFFRPSSNEWFILRSEDASFFSFPFGAAGDIGVPGDYDGDGKVDPAVFRPSNNTWFKLQSQSGFEAITFGIANDIPLPNAYVR